MSANKTIKLAILWHMHQPDYRDPHSQIAAAPWVRLRACKDYLDMLLLATELENIKVTFNLVPSLIEQLNFYARGGSESHLELSRLDPVTITPQQKYAIISNSFKCHRETMIKPYPRYYNLLQKWQNSNGNKQEINFTNEEITDLQVWSNLTWVDPLFRSDALIKTLFEKGENYSESDKRALFDWQKIHISKIIPAYQKSLAEGKIDISFSPYFHPILPLLCDSESAKEALPEIKLPSKRFAHPDDARQQIQMSMDLYLSLFNQKMKGMWPSEGSVSELTANLCSECGLHWIASDEQVLYRSLQKSGTDISGNHPYSVYEHSSKIKILFRDHILSDKIGFVYASWEPEKAAQDFLNHIKSAANRLSAESDNLVVPVILDGENSWEYYKNDGLDFLKTFYRQISLDKDIQTITMTEAAEKTTPKPLKSIFAGSWINHNFRIWIGHEEDNTAWDYLKKARDFLAEFEKKFPSFDPEARKAAWREIYNAEGSDWFWWYGDEHRGPDNYLFDKLFRSHLARAYELLDEPVPRELHLPIISQQYKTPILMPDALLKPTIDGQITHFYEWFGAGKYQGVAADAAMHRTFWLVSAILFGFDHQKFYLRLDLPNPAAFKALKSPQLIIRLKTADESTITLPLDKIPLEVSEKNQFSASLTDILEMTIERKFLWTEGFGKVAFRVEIYDDGQLIEKWPENEDIECDLPEINKEIFWLQ